MQSTYAKYRTYVRMYVYAYYAYVHTYYMYECICAILPRLSDATTPLWNVPYEEQLKVCIQYALMCVGVCYCVLSVDEDD